MLCLFGCCLSAVAQVNWKDTSLHFKDIAWNNYSTSYLGDDVDSIPLIVAAIPYNGIYDHGVDGTLNSPVDLSFNGSAFRFRSQKDYDFEQQHLLPLSTYDTGMVYFLTPGIFSTNAHLYEFSIWDNDSTVVKPWGPVTAFTDPSFGLNTFRKGMGFLGGYTAAWGHSLVVLLRKRGETLPLCSVVVYWQQARPLLSTFFTTREWMEKTLKLTNDYNEAEVINNIRMEDQYFHSGFDSGRALPKGIMVAPNPEGLVFKVRAQIYKKEALEYRLIRNGKVETGWRSNKADNSYIWLENLDPGDYILEMRYRKQRHNVTSYPFTVKPAWYQTWAFRLIAAVLVLAFIGFLVLLFKLRRQRQKTAAEQAKKDRFEQGLKSVYAQLNPHFTFNALSSIQSLINNNDIKGANRYLSEFGNLVRNSLADSERPSIPLQRELQTLDTYLTLERLRFNFAYIIHCAEGLPVAEIEIPSLLLQPLAENAVKHGVATLQEQGIIRVDVLSQQRDMIIRISDNGAGFDAAKETQGYGLKLTRDRIGLLNEMAGTQPILLTIASEPGKGAAIELLFKNWLA